MLTRDIFFGMDMLTLAGFVVMGLTLTLKPLTRRLPGSSRHRYSV